MLHCGATRFSAGPCATPDLLTGLACVHRPEAEPAGAGLIEAGCRLALIMPAQFRQRRSYR